MPQTQKFIAKILFFATEPNESMLIWSFLPEEISLDTAKSSADVFKRFKKTRYNIILVDTQMLARDNSSILKKIREHESSHALGSIPIVAVITDKKETLQAEFTDYLSKPINQQELSKIISKYIHLPQSSRKLIYIDPEVKDFIPEFLENRKRDSKIILNNLEQNDFAKIRELGHKMMGSGKLFGFERISKIGYLLDYAARKKDKMQIQKLCLELLTYLDEGTL